MSKVPITVRGAEKLKNELQKLKSEDRPRVIEAIADARAHGDLKENAEYHAAREQQGFIEGRIKDIEGKLSNATIIDVTTLQQNGKVVFGVTVDVADEETGDELTYQIVGDDEADIKNNKISISSLIARALIGKEEGEVVDVVGPICEGADFLAKDRALPPVERGDILSVFTAGAYGFTMASNYNARGRTPEVLVDGDQFSVIRKRETYEDLIALEK